MSRELHKAILGDLSARKAGWEDKQRTFYDMRHDGLPRRNKPTADAADLHYPLTDGMIEKLKPFYFSQVFGQELLANFTAQSPQNEEITQSVARWFDWQLKERSNLFLENLVLDDLMLMCGTAPMKLYWDPPGVGDDQLVFDAIDPVYFVVPPECKDIEKADRVAQIMPMTVAAYKRDWRYKQDADLLRRIRGKGAESVDSDTGGKETAKYEREGITHGEGDDNLVLWEVYERDGRDWIVHTFAPTAPGEPVRDPFTLPKVFLGLPYVNFPAEVKDKGHYASRGVVEKEGQFEAYLCRVWNEKADSMTQLSRPIWTTDNNAAALNNVRLVPGQIVPGGLRRVEAGKVPFDFDAEMRLVREFAQEHGAMPDFGLGRSGSTSGKKTAREADLTANLMQQNTDLRAWIKRHYMAKLYRKAWSLCAHYGRQQLAYVFDGQSEELSEAALATSYTVMPEGSPDAWNKPARQQRARERAELYGQNPYIDQAELTKHVLEEDDPRLKRRLFKDPRMQQASQAEDQAHELVILREGWPAVVTPADDDNIHLQTCYQWGLKVRATGEAVPPVGVQRIMQHVTQHIEQLGQKDRAAATRWQQAFMQFAQAMGAGAGQPAGTGAPIPPGAPAAAPAMPTGQEVLL